MVANLLTLSRIGFLSICVWLLYQPGAALKWIAFGLVILIILIDAIDGTVARKRGEASKLGAVLDIAIDRVVENVFWIVLSHLQLVSVWGALVVVMRGILTDAVRGFALAQGLTPFAMMQTRLGQLLVSHRFMRAMSGLTKTVTFTGWIAFLALQEMWAAAPQAQYLPSLELFLQVMTALAILVNLARGVPVLVESRRFFEESMA